MISALYSNIAAVLIIAYIATRILAIIVKFNSLKSRAMAYGAMAIISLLPVSGVSSAGFVLGFSPSLSVAGTALWAMLAVRYISGKFYFEDEMFSLSIMIFAISSVVYVSEIGGIGLDLYGGGYGFTSWDIVLAVSAVMAYAFGYRLWWVLMACMVAHSSGLMVSSNIFDTLVDGPAFFASIVIIIKMRKRKPETLHEGLSKLMECD